MLDDKQFKRKVDAEVSYQAYEYQKKEHLGSILKDPGNAESEIEDYKKELDDAILNLEKVLIVETDKKARKIYTKRLNELRALKGEKTSRIQRVKLNSRLISGVSAGLSALTFFLSLSILNGSKFSTTVTFLAIIWFLVSIIILSQKVKNQD